MGSGHHDGSQGYFQRGPRHEADTPMRHEHSKRVDFVGRRGQDSRILPLDQASTFRMLSRGVIRGVAGPSRRTLIVLEPKQCQNLDRNIGYLRILGCIFCLSKYLGTVARTGFRHRRAAPTSSPQPAPQGFLFVPRASHPLRLRMAHLAQSE